MTDAMNNWNVQLIGVLAIGAAATAAFWIGEGFDAAWPVAALMLAFTAVVHFGRRRSHTLEVMSGVGDERVRALYTRAVALSGLVMSIVLPGWWLVTLAQGDPNETLNVVCAIFGATFLVAVIVIARRG